MNRKQIATRLNTIIIVIVFSQPLFAKENTIKLFIWSNKLSPIISHSNLVKKSGSLESYQGIVVDVLSSLPENIRPAIKVILLPRKRGELNLSKGIVDFTILSPKWLNQPEQLLFSSPIYVHREYLYATKEVSNISLHRAVEGKKICTRHGYKFPNIQPFFDSGKVKRIDSQEEDSSFILLLRKRCDYVLTNEYVANSIIKRKNWQELIYRSTFVVDEVNFTFAFHPKHEAFVAQLNTHISALVESGKLADILALHTN